LERDFVQPDLSGNPFFCGWKSFGKKRLGAEGGKAALKI
jgi:hypothetical protein